MKLTTVIMALVASAAAISDVLTTNSCAEDIFLTLANDTSIIGTYQLPTGTAFNNSIIGKGETSTITKTPDVFSAVPKLVLGYSTDNGILYWSVNNVTGDPFVGEEWSVQSNGSFPNFCSNTSSYGSNVYACQDQDVTLLLDLC